MAYQYITNGARWNRWSDTPLVISLIAIQNGTAPERIVSFNLSTPTTVDGWEVLEANWPDLGDPTHGVVVGDGSTFIANSGWDRVDRTGTMTAGKPAEIRKLLLTKP